MAKQYAWSTTTNYASDTDLSYGVIPDDPSWHTTDATTGSATATYFFRDANVSSGGAYTDANSSRVAVNVTNSWTASINDSTNVLTITLTTTINSIVRDDFRGANQDTPGRVITVYNSNGTTVFGPYTDTNLTSYHQISGTINVGQTTITLQPGQSAERSALQLHNQTAGYQSYDDIGIGVRFRNPLPGPVNYALRYNANGGSGAPSAQAATSVNDSYPFTVSSTIPTRTNYRFDGWAESQSGGTLYHGGDTFTLYRGTPDKTLYAQWTRLYDYSVAYDANGGSGAPVTQTYTGPETSHTFTLSSAVPTWQYHKFDGWKYNGTMYQPGATVTLQSSAPGATMVAQWTPYWDATLTYDANGGYPDPAAQTAKVHPDTPTKDFTVTSATPSWGLYKFLGWSTIKYTDSRTVEDVEYVAGDTFTIQKSNPSRKLYAVWMMDYRPGATLNTQTNIWRGHERPNGACHVLSNVSNMTWQECRTIGGAEGEIGNAPSIATAADASHWRNQKRLGKED